MLVLDEVEDEAAQGCKSANRSSQASEPAQSASRKASQCSTHVDGFQDFRHFDPLQRCLDTMVSMSTLGTLLVLAPFTDSSASQQLDAARVAALAADETGSSNELQQPDHAVFMRWCMRLGMRRAAAPARAAHAPQHLAATALLFITGQLTSVALYLAIAAGTHDRYMWAIAAAKAVLTLVLLAMFWRRGPAYHDCTPGKLHALASILLTASLMPMLFLPRPHLPYQNRLACLALVTAATTVACFNGLLTVTCPTIDGCVRSLMPLAWAATVRGARNFDAVSDGLFARLLFDQVRPNPSQAGC
jgi:hypothetical protein